MNRKITLPIAEPILQLQRQLEQFRSTRTKLPEALWQAAVEPARQLGVYPVELPRDTGARLKYWGAIWPKRIDRGPGRTTLVNAHKTGLSKTNRDTSLGRGPFRPVLLRINSHYVRRRRESRVVHRRHRYGQSRILRTRRQFNVDLAQPVNLA